MQPLNADTRAAWTVDDLNADMGWIYELDERARRDLTQAVKRARDPTGTLLDYRRADFDLGSAWPAIGRALTEIKTGRGLAVLRGLPRVDMTAEEFELLTWAIGLHAGVARPQGKATRYLSAVKDIGTVYRSGGGRGYSSNAELDFHTDGADVVLLSCYNVARSGGMSMVTSSVTAHNVMVSECPGLAEVLHQDFYFSRQAEQAPDEGPWYPNPLFDVADGLLFSKWNRNRVTMAQRLPGVPALTEAQRQATECLDEVLRRPSLMYAMYLQPGDMQLLNSHVTLHSRTEFEDHDVPAMKRTLFRLWLAPPDSTRLPESWQPFYRSVAPGTVRGGIIGQAYDETRRGYERRAAADLGMQAASDL
jgi:TfdA family taurine catabolism dioxygenase TauD